ncbi:hypothetical protein ACFXJ8_12085 [Nonomuraea sp. NPDC059194]|uniref:hypothetical protein n=1 Tax=Nonomuraea sp. NPDC059194 TaxID=3346764 RepID=UPI0036D15D2A
MAHSSTVRTVIVASVATAALWGMTITMALTEYGSDRLHLTLLIGSFLAASALIGTLAVKASTARVVAEAHAIAAKTSTDLHAAVALVAEELNAAVAQASDELHEAVAEVGKACQAEHETVAIARVLMARLNAVVPQVKGHDWAA